jgi:hypothetical protein
VSEKLPRGPESLPAEEKAALTRKVLEVLQLWRVEPMAQCQLLGLPDKDAGRRFRRYRAGTPLPDNREVWTRVGLLLRIDNAASQLFPHSAFSANLWVTTPSKRFGGRTPLALMLEQGLEGIRRVERAIVDQDLLS